MMDSAKLSLEAAAPLDVPDLGTPGRKVARRRNLQRFGRALRGEHTRVTKARVA